MKFRGQTNRTDFRILSRALNDPGESALSLPFPAFIVGKLAQIAAETFGGSIFLAGMIDGTSRAFISARVLVG